MTEGEETGKPDQELESDGRYEIDEDKVSYEIVVFIGTYPKLGSHQGQANKDKKNDKPHTHEPRAKDPFILYIAVHSSRRKIVAIDL
jgi:hypothetical protein